MNAEYLFEMLGWKKVDLTEIQKKIPYLLVKYVFADGQTIAFNQMWQTVSSERMWLTPQLYQAITQQMKELGWI